MRQGEVYRASSPHSGDYSEYNVNRKQGGEYVNQGSDYVNKSEFVNQSEYGKRSDYVNNKSEFSSGNLIDCFQRGGSESSSEFVFYRGGEGGAERQARFGGRRLEELKGRAEQRHSPSPERRRINSPLLVRWPQGLVIQNITCCDQFLVLIISYGATTLT